MNNNPVILFDGVCNLCNGSVQFVIKHDQKAIFKFASLQGAVGQQLLREHNMPDTGLSSFILIQEGKVYTKSTAALTVAKQLSGVVKYLYIFKVIPASIRDVVYNFIAQNRYKWFGRKEQCMVPTSDMRARFLN